ncbi:MAG: hypothetical protein ABJX82_08965, partial [Paracoccaceae bacterium]
MGWFATADELQRPNKTKCRVPKEGSRHDWCLVSRFLVQQILFVQLPNKISISTPSPLLHHQIERFSQNLFEK